MLYHHLIFSDNGLAHLDFWDCLADSPCPVRCSLSSLFFFLFVLDLISAMLVSLMSFSFRHSLCLSFCLSPIGFSVLHGGADIYLSGSGFARWDAFKSLGNWCFNFGFPWAFQIRNENWILLLYTTLYTFVCDLDRDNPHPFLFMIIARYILSTDSIVLPSIALLLQLYLLQNKTKAVQYLDSISGSRRYGVTMTHIMVARTVARTLLSCVGNTKYQIHSTK